jgi:hypothetical protein
MRNQVQVCEVLCSKNSFLYPFKDSIGGSHTKCCESNQDMQADPSQGRPQPNPPRGQGQMAVHPPRWPENQEGPGTLRDQGTIQRL